MRLQQRGPDTRAAAGIVVDARRPKNSSSREGIGSNYWTCCLSAAKTRWRRLLLRRAGDLANSKNHCAAPAWLAWRPGPRHSILQICAIMPLEVKDYARNGSGTVHGRFGTVDLDNAMHDYGFTSLTTRRSTTFCDARTGKSIRDWISGRRIVEGDHRRRT